MRKNFLFAQISDLHFGSFALSPLQFFSKRWLGNFNYLLSRKKDFAHERLLELISLFKEKGVTHVIVTGDLSVTARRSEFSMGKKFVNLLKQEGFSVFLVPGNHDQYTRGAFRKMRYYRYFDSSYDAECPVNLKSDKVSYTQLEDGLWLVGLDTAVATSLISSQGNFSPQAEESLAEALSTIPKDDQIILLNHFPFFQNDPANKQLLRGEALKALLAKHPNVLLYLHGHTHRQTIADLRPSGLPIISDTGSTPHKKGGACHLFSLNKEEVELAPYHYTDKWEADEPHTFTRD